MQLIQPIRDFINDFQDVYPEMKKIPWELGLTSLLNNENLNVHSFPRFYIETVNYIEATQQNYGDIGTLSFVIQYIDMDPKKELYTLIDDTFTKNLFEYIDTRDDIIIKNVEYSNKMPGVFMCDYEIEMMIG